MVKTNLDSDGKIFTCYQRVEYKDGDTFFFRIVASSGELTKEDVLELEKTVASCFNFSIKEDSIFNAVKNIRTIFRNLGEIELEVKIKKGEKTSSAVYKLGNLTEYKESKKIDDMYKIETIVDKSGLLTKWSRKSIDIEYLESIKDIADRYRSLLKVLPNEINNNDRILCTIYEQFYGKMPDFRNNEEVVRMHLLNLYLSSFELNLAEEDECLCTSIEGYQILPSQQKQIEKLKLFGDLKDAQVGQYFKIDLNDCVTGKINSIMAAFNKSADINNTDLNNLAILKNIAKIAYLYAYKFMKQDRSIADYTSASGMPEDEVGRALTFYRTARTKIQS